MKLTAAASCIVLLAVMAAGCSGGGGPSSEEAQDPGKNLAEPVTLTFFTEGNSAILAETIEQLVAQKFPHITLKTIKSGKGSTIEDLLNSGNTPDLISYSLGGLWKMKEYQLLSDLSGLIQKYDFDLNRYAPGVVETVKSYSDDGKIMLIPFELNNNVLFYNKGIFDKFGVPYPKDGMTWEQLYEVAKKVTQMDSGVQYKGMQIEGINLVYKNQMGQRFVNPQTLRAEVTTDSWKRWLETMSSFYKISGGEPTDNYKINFLKNQNLAMASGPNFLTEIPDAADKGLNWDVVSLPRFAGMEDKGSQMNAPYYVIPPSSKHKDAAFQVIQYMLSDEVQKFMARQGRIPIVKDEAIRGEYAKGLKGMEGKNIAAFFKDTIGAPISPTKYDAIAKSALNSAFNSVSANIADINTALRQAEEDINKQIEADLKK
ncbi:ABC transporter substrate-binding protein [Paenibacillus hamazuiensis]|uniref:ABC transporter substrate-binding protein n=1 Tax=Paenibacillus hamazuiensis TaxID=2936508 RepID=UPI00200EB783|nr:extracellular solute-binding protein [Paenibacillus hamazuiensis]